jgi:hypothetical protein
MLLPRLRLQKRKVHPIGFDIIIVRELVSPDSYLEELSTHDSFVQAGTELHHTCIYAHTQYRHRVPGYHNILFLIPFLRKMHRRTVEAA